VSIRGNLSDQELYERFWHRTVHVVHGHMVCIVSTPAQSGFGQIARPNDKSFVHQQRCSHPRLDILKDRIASFVVGQLLHLILQ